MSKKSDKIQIFSQTRKSKVLVGVLWRESGSYFFEYDLDYQKSKNAVALGPEFDLWKSKFKSKEMFPSLVDRIPSKQNPEYGEYCKAWGIPADEKDPFVLLTTIARRGPSTFVFEAAAEYTYTGEDVKNFRIKLGLSQREFGSLLGLNQNTIVRLEKGYSRSDVILRYVEICDQVKEAREWIVARRGRYIHDEKVQHIIDNLDNT